MSFLFTQPQLLADAASDLAGIGSTLNAANAAAALPTTSVLAAGADEVSAVMASMFGAHAQQYQSVGAQAANLHAQFVQAMNAASGAYTDAEATNAKPMQAQQQAEQSGQRTTPNRVPFGADGGPAGLLRGAGGNGQVVGNRRVVGTGGAGGAGRTGGAASVARPAAAVSNTPAPTGGRGSVDVLRGRGAAGGVIAARAEANAPGIGESPAAKGTMGVGATGGSGVMKGGDERNGAVTGSFSRCGGGSAGNLADSRPPGDAGNGGRWSADRSRW